MIQSLYIKNFALIDELEVSFQKGLNILTGQTGAGKSIIIGALNMVLGERADTEVVRQGANKAVAEAVIEIGANKEIEKILNENAVEFSSQIILRREIRETGSRAFINDTPVTVGILKEVGDFLVDLHGQHDHQFLLKDENHRMVIDTNESVQPLLLQYKKTYSAMAELQKKLRALKQREADLTEKSELFQFQVNELQEAQLDPGEEKELIAEMTLLDNAEELERKAGVITELGNGEDINIIDMLNTIKIHLEDLTRIEPEFKTYLDEVNTARISIQEAVQFTERYRDSIEFNPLRLEELRQRQSELNKLQKKYGRDIPGLIRYLNEIRSELNLAQNFDLEIGKMEKELKKLAEKLREDAVALHDKRITTGNELAFEIEEKLKHLGIPYPKFEVKVNWLYSEKGWTDIEGRTVECTFDGCDNVLFFISTNKGEQPKPLAKIASGGEVSRVMLALKSILAQRQQLPVMIFDEIDTGISGHISEKVGGVMRRLAEHCQIIAITHQPQIASQAHKHYKVEKTETSDRTVTKILELNEEEHIREVAGLMSGEQISDSAINNAKELIEKNTFNKN